uniref:Matrix metalloproteinase-20b n=1 Tax=Scatophagus argus TaxID=75038 RepID=A0A9E8DG13_SCAAR|nr:matrix metalloproteinase-20b [Scatophagus argus]
MGRMKRSSPSFTSKVKDMQIFFGLNATGALDSDTLVVMSSPRCGVPDVEEYSHIQGTRWNKNVITYSIGKYTRDLPRNTVDSLVESAFSVWARASGLTFVRSHTHSADIMVEFVSSGPVRVRPNYISRLGSQYNPWASGSLFPRLMQNKCDPDLTFDAVSTLGDATFFFRDRYLWIKHNEQYDIKEGPITNFMPKIETSIDAAFWVPRRSTAYLIHGFIYFFVGPQVYKYDYTQKHVVGVEKANSWLGC